MKRPPAAAGTSSGHRARKRFGQHFLVDESILHRIVEIVAPQRSDTLIEIGPGLGALTDLLMQHVDRLVAIEIDRDLGPRLQARYGKHIELVQADVLSVDFAQFTAAAQAPLRIVGNLPYNISTPLLFHLLPHAAQVRDQCFMLQKEVVERMVAQPGSKAYGRLSVMLQWRYRMFNVLDVPPSAFDPPPKVDSAVVLMTPHAQPPQVSVPRLESLVAAAFSQRRKILRHTLAPWLAQHGIDAPGFDMQRRAEEVGVEEYVALAR
ncbi:MAG: 16S rRNA (adenine(1518)-N(6)/adenine(1519)-N(6))-dimethyltransferase RsmA [Betaproteobacteria bacterium]|nr:16S rRNA (adenine(1518)-N(6)/adenine(1519)-N(6))-dimethyltransferase RsmA [Betaproteobacteria bacterium]